MNYPLLANAVLIVHVAFVVFVVITVPLILLGGARNWAWVRLPWLRVTHVAGIGLVVAQAWAGLVCPLTSLEMWLRKQGGEATYAGDFIRHWLQRLLYWDAPSWLFVTVYTVFALLVLAAWLCVPPHRACARNSTLTKHGVGAGHKK